MVWNDELLTNPDAEKEPIDLSKIDVPFYALYGAGTTTCPMQINKDLLDPVAAVKRSIVYEIGDEPTNSIDFWKSPPKISTDVVTILGSGAEALIAAAAALTLLSTA